MRELRKCGANCATAVAGHAGFPQYARAHTPRELAEGTQSDSRIRSSAMHCTALGQRRARPPPSPPPSGVSRGGQPSCERARAQAALLLLLLLLVDRSANSQPLAGTAAAPSASDGRQQRRARQTKAIGLPAARRCVRASLEVCAFAPCRLVRLAALRALLLSLCAAISP